MYAVGHVAVTDLGWAVAALLAIGPGAVLSHRTAAWLWSLISSMPPFIEVTVTGRRPRSRPGIVLHEAAALERTVHCGVPVATPLQTLRQLDPRDRDRATREALVQRLITQREADDLHRGELMGPTRNELERAFLALIDRAGLEPPLVNHRIGRYEVDFAWPAVRVVAETDGWAAHGHRSAFERDRVRDAALAAAGHRVVRFTWRQVTREPLAVAVRLGQVLAVAA